MSTYYRALCAELLNAWDNAPEFDLSGVDQAMDRARAALAQPEPPAKGEAVELVALIRQIALAWEPDACLLGNMTAGQLARAADLLERLAQPEPVGPTDEELRAAYDEVCWGEMDADNFIKATRAVLARWGNPSIYVVPCGDLAEPEVPADGEVAELVRWLRSMEDASIWFEEGETEAKQLLRVADLLERLAQPESAGVTDDDAVAACPFDSFHEPAEHHGWWSAIEWAEQRWGHPAIKPVPADELLAAYRAGAADAAPQPIPVSELLEPEWVRQEDQTHKTTDHAQLIDGEWWAPCSDLFSMQRIVDNARAHSARWGRQPAPDAAAPCATGG